jgi:TolB-like protein
MTEPPSPDRPAPEPLWIRIKEHKVLQWGLAYFGAALALAHAQELVGHAFNWPEVVSRLTIGALAVGFPLVIALAWYHGHKGMTRTTQGEMTVIAVLLVIGAGLLMALARVPDERAPEPAANPAAVPIAAVTTPVPPKINSSGKPRIAVLPFDNLSPDPANAYFADGLYEEILATLAQRAPGLEVISRTTMMMYRQKPKALGDLAKELSATHVIEGSVRRVGNQVRLTLQLIDARTDDHIWAQDYDRTLANTLALQSEVAKQVATELAVQLKAQGPASSYDPEAYDLYLKALGTRNALVSVGAPDGPADPMATIMDGFTRAIDKDPTLAPAYVERMFGYLRGLSEDPENAVRARRDLETAERLAPADPKVLVARAWYLVYADLDSEAALRAFDAAEAAGLTDPDELLDKSSALLALHRDDEAIRYVQRLLTLDPHNRLIIGWLTIIQARNRHPLDALRTVDAGIRQLPQASELKKMRAQLIFDYTGDISVLQLGPNDDSIFSKYYRLRLGHQYAQLARVLASGPPYVSGDGIQFDPRLTPTALLRGWTNLLLNEASNARSDGQMLLKWVAQQKESKWNRAFLRVLAAQGQALAGERAAAIAAGQQALMNPGVSPDILNARESIDLSIAAVFAWSGATEQAVDLLEGLAKSPRGPGPIRIARDPLYTVPLAKNARFQRLVSDLEAQARTSPLSAAVHGGSVADITPQSSFLQ